MMVQVHSFDHKKDAIKFGHTDLLVIQLFVAALDIKLLPGAGGGKS